ncbi:hypothetical protein FOZ63_017083 [Perkinsus olseni]|uniref:Uncharacterized protein n=1 Tax=Perkinsus olseni TaxID=32597 RepID=A0A7J6QM31_PEROL|nr:hypothetical protein FOZ60_009022 [Perkinsus olseni]KAF4709333.1 hypothetical protein FOZ63_017083 [Perkinsus olseni]KAF4711858.1 hypothetical protein FOZ62_026462 [Perkinsus olseni]
MYFQFDCYRSAQLVYNYFGIHGYSLRYNDVTFEGDKIILKRHGRTEGPDLFPYFDVGFDLRWSPSSPGVVQMVAKKALYSYNLTRDCTAPPGSKTAKCVEPRATASRELGSTVTDGPPPIGKYSAVPGPDGNAIEFSATPGLSTSWAGATLWDASECSFDYVTGDSEYTLEKEGSGEIFKFSNPLTDLTSDFLKVGAEFAFNSAENAVYFVPNDKSKPRIKLTAD